MVPALLTITARASKVALQRQHQQLQLQVMSPLTPRSEPPSSCVTMSRWGQLMGAAHCSARQVANSFAIALQLCQHLQVLLRVGFIYVS
jgi:hypothetical protein